MPAARLGGRRAPPGRGRPDRPAATLEGGLATGVVSWVPATVALGLVILGVLPERDAALYFVASALLLLGAALLLLQAVFRIGFAAWGVPTAGDEDDRPVAQA